MLLSELPYTIMTFSLVDDGLTDGFMLLALPVNTRLPVGSQVGFETRGTSTGNN